jgi:hypothetical protein
MDDERVAITALPGWSKSAPAAVALHAVLARFCT